MQCKYAMKPYRSTDQVYNRDKDNAIAIITENIAILNNMVSIRWFKGLGSRLPPSMREVSGSNPRENATLIYFIN